MGPFAFRGLQPAFERPGPRKGGFFDDESKESLIEKKLSKLTLWLEGIGQFRNKWYLRRTQRNRSHGHYMNPGVQPLRIISA
jgi:hypothetical protein